MLRNAPDAPLMFVRHLFDLDVLSPSLAGEALLDDAHNRLGVKLLSVRVAIQSLAMPMPDVKRHLLNRQVVFKIVSDCGRVVA